MALLVQLHYVPGLQHGHAGRIVLQSGSCAFASHSLLVLAREPARMQLQLRFGGLDVVEYFTNCSTIWLRIGTSVNVTMYYTVWRQCHDPILANSDGSDYSFYSGQQSTTCGGFKGLHNLGQAS